MYKYEIRKLESSLLYVLKLSIKNQREASVRLSQDTVMLLHLN